jgi:hypothetical protein
MALFLVGFCHDEATACGRAILTFLLLGIASPEFVVQLSETCTDCQKIMCRA